MKQIIYEDPFVLDEVCLKLDYPVKKLRSSYWPHFAYLLGASEETKKRCQNRSNYKPSLMMFTYLSTRLPDFTVNDLAFHLGEIKKGNLISLLEQSCVKGKSLISIFFISLFIKNLLISLFIKSNILCSSIKFTYLVSLAVVANLITCNAFFVVFRTQKGVIVPGVPCGDRGNWD